MYNVKIEDKKEVLIIDYTRSAVLNLSWSVAPLPRPSVPVAPCPSIKNVDFVLKYLRSIILFATRDW